MITDLNQAELNNKNFGEFDVAIIGAGAAGITLANKLSFKNKKVALIEGGNYDYSEESQEIYSAKTIGDPYFQLDSSRLRYFGGSTNHWTGWCRTFEAIDFDRSYLGKEYKWPINLKDIDAYIKESCEILEIPNIFNDYNLKNSNIRKIDFKFSPPVRFREKYFQKLSIDKKVNIFLNSNLTDLQVNSKSITSAILKSYNFKTIRIRAKKFVFAMGGIENSRYLLWLHRLYGDSLFTKTPALGRYWMEHPHFTLGQAIVRQSKVNSRFYALSEQTQKRENILNCGLRVEHLSEKFMNGLIHQVLCVAPKLGKKLIDLAGKNLVCGVKFKAAWEQAPDYSNRILLDKKLDKFGIPKPILRWKKNSIDRRTIIKSIEEFNKWLLEIDGGRIQLSKWIVNEGDYPTDDALGGHHHMGGTRMHEDIEFGVVDSNCKVFGSNNLYIAGSSVFTTGGHNNPTLPIIQLSLRLADHITK